MPYWAFIGKKNIYMAVLKNKGDVIYPKKDDDRELYPRRDDDRELYPKKGDDGELRPKIPPKKPGVGDLITD